MEKFYGHDTSTQLGFQDQYRRVGVALFACCSAEVYHSSQSLNTYRSLLPVLTMRLEAESSGKV